METGFFEIKKRRELQVKEKENQRKIEMLKKLQEQLAGQYGFEEKQFPHIRKEYNRLEYVGRFEQMEQSAKKEKIDLMRQYKNVWQEAGEEYQEADGKLESMQAKKQGREILDRIYEGQIEEKFYQAAVEKVDNELKQITESNSKEDIRKKARRFM